MTTVFPLISAALFRRSFLAPTVMSWFDTNKKTYEAGAIITDFNVKYTALLEYTLKDGDVYVENGIIRECKYDITARSIIIPETLDGQIVTGIGDYIFSCKGILIIFLLSRVSDTF